MVEVHTSTINDIVVAYSFKGSPDGASPFGALAPLTGKDANAIMIGATGYGGNGAGDGTIFELRATSGPLRSSSGDEKVLYTFGGSPDASRPFGAPVVVRQSGKLEASVATYYGGAHNLGALFTFRVAGRSGVAYSFSGTPDGANPLGTIAVDTSCNLYGTSEYGGAHNLGAVWELRAAGTRYQEKVLYSFVGGTNDGQYPYAGVTRGKNGLLYGTTVEGGQNDLGTVFAIDLHRHTNPEIVLHSFAGPDGMYPYAGLTDAANGKLYGTTSEGGAYHDGTVFSIGKGAPYRENPIWSFGASSSDGAAPGYGNVGFDEKGDIYGTTILTANSSRGAGGTFYVLEPSDTSYDEAVYDFAYHGAGGDTPYAGPTADDRGNVYVGTIDGGAYGFGTIDMFPAKELPGRMAPIPSVSCK